MDVVVNDNGGQPAEQGNLSMVIGLGCSSCSPVRSSSDVDFKHDVNAVVCSLGVVKCSLFQYYDVAIIILSCWRPRAFFVGKGMQ